MRRPLPSGLSAVAIILCAGAALGDELWRQNHVDCAIVPNGCYGGISSQDARNPGGLGWMYEVADNFDAAAGWTITNLEFWGAQATSTPAVTDGFMIRFYADNNGQVGALLQTQDVFVFTQEVYFSWPLIPSFQGFRYTLDLNQPFAVPGAGRYWMSIVAIQPFGGNPDYRQWGWNLAHSINPPVCQQSSSPPGGHTPQANDVAFVLFGTAGTTPCYANCDASTTAPVLNVADFGCFLTRYAAGEPYANCDESTQPPVLNVADFGCFLTRYATGCP